MKTKRVIKEARGLAKAYRVTKGASFRLGNDDSRAKESSAHVDEE